MLSWRGAWSCTGMDVTNSILEVPMELISRRYSKRHTSLEQHRPLSGIVIYAYVFSRIIVNVGPLSVCR